MSANAHLVTITLSDEDIAVLTAIAKHVGPPANGVIKRIIYQANDSPIFCSAYNKPIRHLNPKAATCQPFPYACNTCPLACFEE